MTARLALCAVVTLGTATSAGQLPGPAEQAAMRAHVMFLASDEMRGREAGSAEYQIAARYVAAQFHAAGLRPAGDKGSYFQAVPLVRYLPGAGSFRLERPKWRPLSLVSGIDYLPGSDPDRADVTLRAPMVFVGQGIVGRGRDDYRGVDVRGKIVVFFRGAPSSFPAEERVFLANPIAKAEIARKRGAIGYLLLESPPGQTRLPFDKAVAAWAHPRLTWSGSGIKQDLPWLGMISHVGAAKLFEGASVAWPKVLQAAATDGAPLKAMPLLGTLTIRQTTTSTSLASTNVAGILPGSDPALGRETVILSAHLDHVGVGEADETGDRTYNGAMDNAVGIAALIEEARRFQASGKPPRRSILFLAVTAEEEGLIGSDYFAGNPTVPSAGIVADINLDMPIITYPFEDIIPYGAEHSTLIDAVRRAAASAGVAVSPDPRPEEAFFMRSDHFSFVERGIPSLFLSPGEAGPGKAATAAFLARTYHRPSDALDQTPAIDWQAGVRFTDLNYRIAREIADTDRRPLWNKGDLFGLTFGGPMAD